MTKRKKIVATTLVSTVLLLAAGLYLAKLMSQPANGTVLVPTTSIVATKPSVKTFNTAYFSTRYSGRYQLLAGPNPKSASLASWTFIAKQAAGVGESSKFNLIVTTLLPGGVTEDSAYKLYHAQPALYKLSAATYNHDSVVIAVRHDPSYEQTVLWPHQQYLLTVSLTAPTQTDLVDSELQTVLSNLHWVQ